MAILLQPDWLEARLDQALASVNRKLQLLGGEPVDGQELMALCMRYRERLQPMVIDTVPVVRAAVEQDRAYSAGGSAWRDARPGLGHLSLRDEQQSDGSVCCVWRGLAAAGHQPRNRRGEGVQHVRGRRTVSRWNCMDETGDRLRGAGDEFGATTGRPRRCGWFDGVAIRYATWLNGMTGLAVTKLDVLDEFEVIRICMGYRLPSGEVIDGQHAGHAGVCSRWSRSMRSGLAGRARRRRAGTWNELPAAAQRYVERISELAGVDVDYVSVGPEREQMIVMA